MLDQAAEALRQKYPAAQVQPLLDKFRALGDDGAFWTHRLDGLAILGSPETFEVFDLRKNGILESRGVADESIRRRDPLDWRVEPL